VLQSDLTELVLNIRTVDCSGTLVGVYKITRCHISENSNPKTVIVVPIVVMPHTNEMLSGFLSNRGGLNRIVSVLAVYIHSIIPYKFRTSDQNTRNLSVNVFTKILEISGLSKT
jgi:hypothetical protein